MINPWHDIPAGRQPPEEISVIVEIPAGSRNKYELDKRTGGFLLDRVLYSAAHYPGDYGFIPRTLAEDGDPCDVLVLIKQPTFPGCRIEARPIGMLRMEDRGDPDNKIVAVPVGDPHQLEYFDIADIPPHVLREIKHFFAIYKDLEGHRVQVTAWGKSDIAANEVAEAMQRYARAFPEAPGGLMRVLPS